MKIIYNRVLPIKGFSAINLCGVVFARRECQPLSARTLNHEAIHAAQQREWLYIGFFILYFFEWIAKGYRGISFEKEAYKHQDEEDYLERRIKFQNYNTWSL